MKTSIVTFDFPQSVIRISNLEIDVQNRKASFTLGIKELGKRKFIEREVTAIVELQVIKWFTVAKPETIKVAADNEQGFILQKTGRTVTNFEKYLKHREIEFKPNILKSLVFEDKNDSEDYYSNPFKVIETPKGFVLTNVQIKPKIKTEYVNPNDGVITTKYKNPTFKDANGKTRISTFSKQFYRRYGLQIIKEVEVYQEA